MEPELQTGVGALSSDKSTGPRRDSVHDSAFCLQLSALTADLEGYPYDPAGWLARALVFEQLGYEELAVGDAYKAQMLCQAHEETLAGSKFMMGHRMGFAVIWEHDRTGDVVLIAEQQGRLRELLRAHRLLVSRLCDRQQYYTPRLYPWLRSEHRCRTDAQLDAWNAELFRKRSAKSREPCCIIRRNAFGSGIGPANGAELLGVCATRFIAKGEILFTDPAKYWGHNNSRAAPKSVNTGLMRRAQSNGRRHEAGTHDFDWIRTEAGVCAADVILRARILEDCQKSAVKHPLEHPVVARLIACYRAHDRREIDAEIHFNILNKVLQKQLKIDIFADHRYDTWVLYTLLARIENNAWSDPGIASLNILFCAFNHSCEPNLDWHVFTTHGQNTTIKLSAQRDIKAGEQLFVIYDQYLIQAPLVERRAAMSRWLDADCQCVKCVREEAALAEGPNGTSLKDRRELTVEDSWRLEARPMNGIQETCVTGPTEASTSDYDQVFW